MGTGSPDSAATARRGYRTAIVASALREAAARYPFVEDEILGLREIVAAGDVCLDVGAEYGLYTWSLAALTGSSGHVHSIEPLPGPARWLAFTAKALNCGNVTIHRAALGADAGTGLLDLPVRRGLPVHGRAYLTDGASGPGPNSEFRGSRQIPTAVLTMDDLVAKHGIAKVGFIKADVEGAEMAVLTGGGQTLLLHRPSVLLEIEDRHLEKYGVTAADVVRHLADLGYRMHRWRDRRWTQAEEVTSDCRNYLFVA